MLEASAFSLANVQMLLAVIGYFFSFFKERHDMRLWRPSHGKPLVAVENLLSQGHQLALNAMGIFFLHDLALTSSALRS